MIKRFLGVLIAILFMNSAICAAAELIIFHTNDMHARIQNSDDSGKSIGLAEMAAAVKEVKSKNPATLWLDAGDTFHGISMIMITKGENLVPLLNAAGIDAMTAGNHDFNYGSAQLEKLAKKMKFPLLDANVIRKSDGKLIFTPYKIFKLNGIKVGVFGLSTPETAYKTNPNNVKTVEFLNPVEVSKEMIKKLRPQCDILIAIMHMGVDASSEFTSERIARETEGIDLIVDGHSHTALADGIRIGDTLIVQAGCYEHFLGRATIEVENHKIISKKAELLDADDVKKIAPVPDKKILKLIDAMNIKSKKFLDEVVTHSEKTLSSYRLLVRRNESELGNLVSDAFRWAAKSDIAITNGGTLRADFPAGDLKNRDILNILPFGNTLQIAEIKGSTIREMLEHSVEYYPASFGGFLSVSGINFSYDPSQPAKQRVKDILIGENPLDEDKIYTIALTDFMTSGGDDYSMLTNLKIIGEYGNYEEALINYLNEVGMKGYEVGRITRLKEIPIPDEKDN